MKSPVKLLCMIAAASLAAPAAMAGNDIVKCVDPQGHVTLTDQPCASGATAIRLVREAGNAGDNAGAGAPGGAPAAAPQRYMLPATELRHPAWQQPAAEHPAPLARDVATLKAARRALMLMESSRQTLAGLQ